jgi:hypothetical protein
MSCDTSLHITFRKGCTLERAMESWHNHHDHQTRSWLHQNLKNERDVHTPQATARPWYVSFYAIGFETQFAGYRRLSKARWADQDHRLLPDPVRKGCPFQRPPHTECGCSLKRNSCDVILLSKHPRIKVVLRMAGPWAVLPSALAEDYRC